MMKKAKQRLSAGIAPKLFIFDHSLIQFHIFSIRLPRPSDRKCVQTLYLQQKCLLLAAGCSLVLLLHTCYFQGIGRAALSLQFSQFLLLFTSAELTAHCSAIADAKWVSVDSPLIVFSLALFLPKMLCFISDLHWHAWMLPYFERKRCASYSKFDFRHLLPPPTTTTSTMSTTKNRLFVCLLFLATRAASGTYVRFSSFFLHFRVNASVFFHSLSDSIDNVVTFCQSRAISLRMGTAANGDRRRREREHTMQRSTSERDMQRSCIMIINTVIVIHCIYLIVTSPLQHFRFGFHNSFLRSSLELDSSFKYIWTFVGFAHAPCVPSSSSLQMVLIELL